MANNQTNRGHQGGTAQNNPGNFANDREKASEAGRKGGQSSGGNFANARADKTATEAVATAKAVGQC